MILLVIALHAATAAQPQARPRAPVARTHHARKARRHVRIARRMHMNVVASARVDPNAQYRLPLREEVVSDGKDRAVRSTGTPCGVTGAPVCPHKGMKILTTPIDGSHN